MNYGKAICNIQGIEYNKLCYVICPYCETKTMLINITKNKAICLSCNKKAKAEEIARVVEADFEKKSSKPQYNKGVGYD